MSDLISGKEALIALANGEDVEYWCESDPSIQKRWTPIKALNEYKLSYFLEDKPHFEFRLKPRTIKINGIEVPAPFDAFNTGNNEAFWYLSAAHETGYACNMTDSFLGNVSLGAWRTEDEIKQVVAALRLIFKGE